MKAMVYTQYGSPDVLQFKEVEKPTPKDNEVLIKMYAAAVNAGDWLSLRGDPFLLRLNLEGSYCRCNPLRTTIGEVCFRCPTGAHR